MNKKEKLAFGILLGTVPPVVGLLAFWWTSVAIYPQDRLVMILAISGMGAGLIVDMVCLKQWVAKAYAYNIKVWMAIYIFYSICVLGFFMGVPVFNILLAVPAGFFMGCRCARLHLNDTGLRRVTGGTWAFTTFVMVLVCFTSAAIALHDPYTGANLRGMLRLPFEVTPGMIGWLIGLGGASLLALQGWLTVRMVRMGYSVALNFTP
jgi:hypothetical protein